jgi:Tol biopolymer transport system component
MNGLRSQVSSLCLSLAVGGVAVMGAGCGKSDTSDPEPLLVPWSQLSGRIAYVRGYNEIIVIDSARREVRLVHRTPPGELVQALAWHPSGNFLTVTVDGDEGWSLASIDVRTGSKTNLYTEFHWAAFAAWSPDGRIAFTSGGETLFIDGVLVPHASMAFLSSPSWSPDGATLALIANDSARLGSGDLNLVDVATGTATPLGPKNCFEPIYSPDGTRIAFTSWSPDQQLRIATVPDGIESHLSGADVIIPSHPAWSPDGSRLVVQSDLESAHPALHLVDPGTGNTVRLTSKDGRLPAWIP